MPDKFDWFTEENSAWETPEPEPETGRPRSRARWIVATLALVLGLSAGIWLLARQAEERIEAAAAVTRADILASHELVQAAADRGDAELLRAVLSGRDRDWVARQEALATAGVLLDRKSMGLAIRPAGGDSPPVVTLDPDLNRAVVTYTRAYRPLTDGGAAAPVRLQHTAVYRRGSERWLVAPPEPDFWGAWQRSRGQYLTLLFPDRDATWALRLADDLDDTLAELCRTYVELACEDDLRLTLRLATTTESLAVLTETTYAWGNARILELPAWSLLGSPVDEAGYQALRSAYARQLVAAAVVRQVEYACCQAAPIFGALLEYELSQLGLGQWPVTEADYRRIFELQPFLTQMVDYWNTTEPADPQGPNTWILYAMIDFLVAAEHDLALDPTPYVGHVSPVDLQRALAPRQNILGWLDSALVAPESNVRSARGLLEELSTRWWHYAQTRSLQVTAPPPYPLPEEDLLLACQSEDIMTSATESGPDIFRYDLQSGESRLVYGSQDFAFATVLPDDLTVAINAYDVQNDSWRILALRDGTVAPLQLEGEWALMVTFGQMDPAREQLVVYAAPMDEERLEVALAPTGESCPEGVCPGTLLPGFPVWSPGGEHVLLLAQTDDFVYFPPVLEINGQYLLFDASPADMSEQVRPLALARSLGPPLTEPVGEGYAPFWLNDTTFGFVRVVSGTQEIVVGQIDRPGLEPLTTSQVLQAAVPEGVAQGTVRDIAYVAPHPTRAGLLYVVMVDPWRRQAHLLLWDRSQGRAQWLLETGYDNHSLAFSPDGNFLVMTGMNSELLRQRTVSTVYLIPLNHGNQAVSDDEIQLFFVQDAFFFIGQTNYDWTPDGRWLVINLGGGDLALLAPATGYRQIITPGLGACGAMSWLAPPS